MPLVTSYSEAALARWMVDELGDVATLLGWTADTAQVVRAVADAEVLLGVADVAAAVDARTVERVGAVAAWRRAVKSLAARYDVAEDGQQASRSQALKGAQAALALAEADAVGAGLALGAAWQVKVARRRYLGDPLTADPASARVLS